jgi:hypothetical protein
MLASAGGDWGAGRCGLEQSWLTLAVAVQSAEFLVLGNHWGSRIAPLWLEIAGDVGLLFPSSSKRDSNCNCRVRVTLQLTVSQSVRLGVEPRLGLMTRYLFLHESCCPVYVGRPL